MTEYIARLESEILGRDTNGRKPTVQYDSEMRYDNHSQEILQHQGQMTTNAQRAPGPGHHTYPDERHEASYDKAEMMAFWRPNRFL